MRAGTGGKGNPAELPTPVQHPRAAYFQEKAVCVADSQLSRRLDFDLFTGRLKEEPWGLGGSATRAQTSHPHSFVCGRIRGPAGHKPTCGVFRSLSRVEPWPSMRY
jgi:hypothetical protein